MKGRMGGINIKLKLNAKRKRQKSDTGVGKEKINRKSWSQIYISINVMDGHTVMSFLSL